MNKNQNLSNSMKLVENYLSESLNKLFGLQG